jgi:peptidyl-prolyl cis-trans isomerase D
MPIREIRAKKNSFITMVIFGLIILSFVLWGGFETITPSSTGLTTVNGEEIPFQDFQRAVNNQLQVYGQAMGGQQELAQSLTQLIERQVAGGLVMQTLMAQKAKEFGIVIGPDEILAKLQQEPAFQDPELKRFSPRIYTQVLELNNLSPTQFEDAIRKQLLGERLRALLESSVWVSPKEAQSIYRIRNAQITLSSARYSQSTLQSKGILKATEQELKDYFQQHQGDFLSAPARKAQVATLSPLALARSISISDEDIKSFFDTTVAGSSDSNWSTPQAHAYHILVSDTSNEGARKAQSLKTKLAQQKNSLEAFQEMARFQSEDFSNAPRGGDLGYFSKATMVKPFADAVFGVKKAPQVIGPVKTDFGHHLIYVADLTGSEKTLASRSQQIRYQLTQNRIQSMLGEIETKFAKAKDKEKFLQEQGFEISTHEKVTSQTRHPNLPFSLIQEISKSNAGDWQPPKDVQNLLMAYRVVEELPAQPLSFEEARAQVTQALLSERLRATVEKDRQELLKNPNTWSALAKRGATLGRQTQFKPFEATEIPGFGAAETLIRAAQNLSSETPLSEILVFEGDLILLKASDFKSLEDLKDQELAKLQEELINERKTKVVSDFMEQAMKEARIPEDFKKKYNL